MSKYKPSLPEQETIILYNQGEKDVEIYTHDPMLIKKLKEQPHIAKLKSVNQFGGYTYTIPKKEMVLKLKYHPTGETLKKRVLQAERMRNARQLKKNSQNK